MSGAESPNIPDAVKKQGERADQIHRQMYPDQYPPEGKEEKPEEGKTPPESAAPKPEDTPKPEEKPKEEPVKAAPEAVTSKPPEKPPEEDWKHKYDVLLGKYNAEVPKLHTQVAAMQNITRELQGQVSELKAVAKEKPAPAKEEPPREEPAKKIEPSPQEIEVVKTFKEEYPDIYEAVARMIESAQGAKPAGSAPKAEEKPRAEEKPKAEGRPGTEEKPKGETPSPTPPPAPVSDFRTTFDYYLNRDVPDWPRVNKDPEFITFLQAPDPNYPGTKLQSIQAAYDACDFTTVIGHFRDFREMKAKSAAPPPNPPNPKPEGEKPPEEKYLAPPRGGRGGTMPSGAPAVTPADLVKFYDDVRRGLWGTIDGEKFRKEEARLLSALTGTKT